MFYVLLQPDIEVVLLEVLVHFFYLLYLYSVLRSILPNQISYVADSVS